VIARLAAALLMLALAAASAPQAPAAAGALFPPLKSAILTQPFGCTALAIEPPDPACPQGHFHSGLDLAAPIGSPVRAAASGRAQVRLDPAGYGLYVVLDAGDGTTTLYAHLESTEVANGQWVSAGSQVGQVGVSGLTTGPHLHFEVRRAGRAIDPLPLLPAGFILKEG